MTSNTSLKRLLWLYFWLLMFEGAMRRWLLPGLSGALLVVRDPVSIAIIYCAATSGHLRYSGALALGVVAGLVSFAAALLFGHGNIAVASFGLRIFVLHFPLLFIIPRVFDEADVARVGRVLCILGLFMTPLIAVQFFLPQEHWINVGVGGEGTGGFAGAEGRFRPPGTFSFISGLASFYSLYAATLSAFVLDAVLIRRWWVLGSIVSLAIAVPLTMSRTVLFSVMVTGVFWIFVAARNRKTIQRLALVALLIAGSFGVAMLHTSFREGAAAFTSRWNGANESEGGMVEGVVMNRFFGGLISNLLQVGSVPFMGYGLGLGTNAGAAIMTGDRTFMVDEGEWGRLIGEMGPILGLSVVGVRMAFSMTLLQLGLRALRAGRPLSMLLCSVTVLWVAQANWAQPTSLGFAVFGGGITAAACRLRRTVDE